MSKSKSTNKAAKPSKTEALSKVKTSGVTKPAKDAKVKKEVAKKVIEKEEKKSKKDKKKVKEPTPEPSSEEEESSESESSESESEVEIEKPAVNGKGKVIKKPISKDEPSESEESDSSESEAPAPRKSTDKKSVVPKTNGAKVGGKKAESSEESDSSASEASDDDETVPAGALLGKTSTIDEVREHSSSAESDSSDDDEEDAKAKINGAAAEASEEDSADEDSATDDSASDSSESEEDEEEEEKPAKINKRKAEVETEAVAKKAKTEATSAGAATATAAADPSDKTKTNIFVGNLSWNVDDAWLRETFEEYGPLAGVRVMVDKATNRAKGYGYVEFVNATDAAQAFEAKSGFELDGRAMNLDWASKKPDNQAQQENRRKSYGDQLSEPSDTLFVGNLSFDVGQEQVSEAFNPHGTIMSVRLPTDQNTGALKGFGYVTFSSIDEAKVALEAMQGAYISNRPVRLDFSQPRPNREDSGFGGRGRGGFSGRGRGGDRGRGGRGGSFGGRGRGAPRGGRGGTTNRGGFGDFSGRKQTFD